MNFKRILLPTLLILILSLTFLIYYYFLYILLKILLAKFASKTKQFTRNNFATGANKTENLQRATVKIQEAAQNGAQVVSIPGNFFFILFKIPT